MTALNVIRVLAPLALALSSMALQAAPGDKTMRVYNTRMETLFIRLDVNETVDWMPRKCRVDVP
mgnify:CR=1 FL=1